MMALTGEQIILTVISILFAPGIFLFVLVIVLAACGRSFGITKLYIKILLLVFEVRLFRLLYCVI